MRFCYVGPCQARPVDPTRPEQGTINAHSCSVISHEFCEELRRLGVEADIWNQRPKTDDGQPTEEAYDVVFLYDHTMIPLWQRVVPKWDTKKKCTVYWCHVVKPEVSLYAMNEAALVAFTVPNVQWDFEHHYGPWVLKNRSMVLTWGCRSNWNCPESLADPYPRHPALLWAARMGTRAAAFLCSILRQHPLDLHVLSATPVLHPGFLKEIPGTYHGSFRYGSFNHFLYHADLAVDTAIGRRQIVANSKLFDYLAAGLPIVHEAVPGDWIIRETQMGIEVPYDNHDLYHAAIQEALSRPWDRKACRQYMQDHHTWAHRARQLWERLQQVI